MSYIIKQLTAADITEAQQLIHNWQIEDGITDTDIPDAEYLAVLLSSDSFHAIVAMDGDLIIGGLTAYELPMFPKAIKEMFLYEISVDERYRQQGIATMLIDQLKSICAAKNIKIIFVGTETTNLPAKKLYKASGGSEEDIAWFTYEL